MIEYINKKFLNISAIVFLSYLSFLWTFWIFHVEFNAYVVSVVIVCRLLASVFIYKDYSLSWSKSTQKTFLLKSFVYLVALVVYVPVFYKVVEIALFLSEFAFFLLWFNFIMYSYYIYKNRSSVKHTKTLVIYGAGNGGTSLAKEYSNSKYKIMYFVDDDKKLHKRSIDGVWIYSSQQLKNKMKNKKFDLLVIAMPSANKNRITQIYSELKEYFNEIKILPSLDKILQNDLYLNQLKQISIEDLLARCPQDLDKNVIGNFLHNKIVLVTGAGGSIGSEICTQCLKYGVKKLYALDHSEYNLYALKEKLPNVITIMHSVLDKKSLKQTFMTCKANILIHAAAYKHVPMVEDNIENAIKNNIIGTKNCIDLADEFGVSKFILISTDKAVRPTNVMGATKRICELYATNKKTKNMEIVAVRFGNVLNSSGSVIPKFYKQIKNGGPLSVTHKDITRYFMLISEACELVLQSGAIGQGGEIFILNMGEPVKILDLAKNMIKLSGKQNIQIIFTGLRPGEKLYEELLINESDIKTKYPSIMISKNTCYDIEKLNEDIKNLLNSCNQIEQLKMIVPEFEHQKNKE